MRVVAPSGNPDDTGGCEIIVAVVPCQFKPNSANAPHPSSIGAPNKGSSSCRILASCSTTKSASCQSHAFWASRPFGRISRLYFLGYLCRLGARRDEHKEKFYVSVTACWTVCCECERWKEEPKMTQVCRVGRSLRRRREARSPDGTGIWWRCHCCFP